MSENNSELSLQLRKDDISGTIQSKHDSSQSLLSIVHDKNKKIEKLQRQLHFQKMQLKFYLGKTFSDTKMISFSKTCHPQSVDDNLPVTLAVNRFNKQSGHKSKIINLYDRMCCIDGRISGLLQVQECFLRKLIGKICEFAKNGSEIDVQLNYRKMLTNPEYMNIFNNLIHANIGLKKSLDTFRICCDRLIVVEEERNLIVDQVYSLPIEQRTNCNYLIGIQIEKVQLQNRMKDILKDQLVLRSRIDQLSTAEEHLSKLQDEYKEAFKTSTEQVTEMLRKINNEAIGLVEKSNLQREKYTKEIVKLKGENCKISRLLERLKVSISDKVMSRDSIKLDSIYSAGLFQALDKEIAQAIKDNEMTKNTTIQKVKSDCKELSQNLRNSQNQNILLTKELDALKIEYEEAKRKWSHELDIMKKERDDYRSQVEDLQAIRTAYAQLVESRADMKATEEKYKQAQGEKQVDKQKLTEMEQENVKLFMEIKDLKDEVNKQKAKNVRLSALIVNMNGNDQKVNFLKPLGNTPRVLYKK
ncbi:hypothetical protein WA026_014581 [Henosepilachna vigintioctopunctata]|uniref:Uncharacterized protein n=1 Tax=Henosepilachna vigintioctopunctata TaxID=420089 RepID=A0AAW1VDI1_9CUCU